MRRMDVPPIGYLAPFMMQGAVIVLFGVLLLTLWQARYVLLATFAGALLSLALYRLSAICARLTRLPRKPLVVVVFILLISFILAFAALFGQQIASQIEELVERLPEALDLANEVLRDVGLQSVANMDIGSGEGATPAGILGGARALVANSAGALIYTVTVMFTSLYFALSPESYREGILTLFPPRRRTRLRQVMNEVALTLGRWLIAQLGIMLMVGTVATLGLWLLGVPLALVLGLIAGLFEFVPIVGPIAASVPAILLGLTVGWTTALYVLAFYIVLNQLEGNILVPLVQENEVKIPPVMTLAGTLSMGAVFGLAGTVLAVPLLVVMLVLAKRLWVEDFLGDEAQESNINPHGSH